MKVAHFVVITPKRCGLYETTRELVAELRNQGVDSRMFDPTRKTNKLYPEGTEDRGAVFCDEQWVRDADIFVNHSGLGEEFEKSDQPIVHIAHGRPRHSFLSEKNGGTPIYSYHYFKNKDPRFKSIVTFWPEHVEYLKFMFPDKPVVCVPSCVDTNQWSPGESSYDFGGKAGKINVVVSDSWRDDIDPFVPINAFGNWAREVDGAKIHIYGAGKNQKGWAALTKRLNEDGNLGLYQVWASNLEMVYRAADVVITGNVIDVRTVREAMACGCPVIKFGTDISDCREKFNEALSESRKAIRGRAIEKFNPANTAKQFREILNGC